MQTLSPAELARRLEQTLARPQATRRDLEQLCAAARVHSFHSVCVNGSRAWFVRHGLDFRAFLREGLDAQTLLATGDAMAQRVVDCARQQRNEQEHT